ncbi:hypothetical protein [Rhodohalobacter sp.]|uniref:hypothetical protein n=1 Tax=Rhodohalobacter sp. TaxID=1974210 RepID=UPI002ACE39B6|nr:hypothetical protein [Rhodohalobacter sp.]MDZ7757526.1 hypothetical protein [Rhodohalobacter sp.]
MLATADHVRYVEQSWQFNQSARQFLNLQQLEMLGETAQTGDRRTDYEYDIRYNSPADPEDYRIRIREKRDNVRNIGNNFVETGYEIMHFR